MIDALEPLEIEEALYRPRRSLAGLPLGLAILLSFALALQGLRILGRPASPRAAGAAAEAWP